MTHLTRPVPWALAAAGAVLSVAVLSGCSADADADASGASPSAPASAQASSGSEQAGKPIGHQTQYVVHVSEQPSHHLLRQLNHLPGVFLASYEPRDAQVRIFFSEKITKAERHDAKRQIRRMVG